MARRGSKAEESESKSRENVRQAGTSMVARIEEMVVPELDKFIDEPVACHNMRWTEEEDAILLKYGPIAPPDAIAKVLREKFKFPRTKMAVQNRICRLGAGSAFKQSEKKKRSRKKR